MGENAQKKAPTVPMGKVCERTLYNKVGSRSSGTWPDTDVTVPHRVVGSFINTFTLSRTAEAISILIVPQLSDISARHGKNIEEINITARAVVSLKGRLEIVSGRPQTERDYGKSPPNSRRAAATWVCKH